MKFGLVSDPLDPNWGPESPKRYRSASCALHQICGRAPWMLGLDVVGIWLALKGYEIMVVVVKHLIFTTFVKQ